jgi:hypothetical protein
MANAELESSQETSGLRFNQAEEFMVLLRGGYYEENYRFKPLTPEQDIRAHNLIEEIIASNPELNRESLELMMFDTPIMKEIPGDKRGTRFGWFDFGILALNWEVPPKEFVDQFKDLRDFAQDHYKLGSNERAFLKDGITQLGKTHPYVLVF